MSDTTSLPYTDEQTNIAAEGVVTLCANPDRDPELAATMTERCLSSAQGLLNGREALQVAEAALKVKLIVLGERDDEADEALTDINTAMKLRGGTAGQALNRSLWGGGTAGEVAALPYASQISRVKGYAVRARAEAEALNLPIERVERVAETNDALELAWTEAQDARRNRELKRQGAEEAQDAFLTDYRAAVRYAILVYEEERVISALPRFPKRRTAKK